MFKLLDMNKVWKIYWLFLCLPTSATSQNGVTNSSQELHTTETNINMNTGTFSTMMPTPALFYNNSSTVQESNIGTSLNQTTPLSLGTESTSGYIIISSYSNISASGTSAPTADTTNTSLQTIETSRTSIPPIVDTSSTSVLTSYGSVTAENTSITSPPAGDTLSTTVPTPDTYSTSVPAGDASKTSVSAVDTSKTLVPTAETTRTSVSTADASNTLAVTTYTYSTSVPTTGNTYTYSTSVPTTGNAYTYSTSVPTTGNFYTYSSPVSTTGNTYTYSSPVSTTYTTNISTIATYLSTTTNTLRRLMTIHGVFHITNYPWSSFLTDWNNTNTLALARDIEHQLVSVYANLLGLESLRVVQFSMGSVEVTYDLQLDEGSHETPYNVTLIMKAYLKMNQFKLGNYTIDYDRIKHWEMVTEKDDGVVLEDWAIAVIVCGICLLLLVPIVICILCNRPSCRKKPTSSHGSEDPQYFRSWTSGSHDNRLPISHANKPEVEMHQIPVEDVDGGVFQRSNSIDESWEDISGRARTQ